MSLPEWKQNQQNSIVMQCSYWVVRLNLAAIVEKAGPVHVRDLAAVTKTHQPALHRVLQTLTERKVFTEVEPEVFCLGPEGMKMKQGQPFSDLIVAEDWKSTDSHEEWYLSVENFLFPQGQRHLLDWDTFFPSTL